MLEGRQDGASATLLPDGRVLETGGNDTAAELYDPVGGTWFAAAPTSDPHAAGTSTLLNDGTVLVAGGLGDGLTSAEIYDPKTDTWTATGKLHTGRYSQTGTLLQDGTVLVAGGQDSEDKPLASAEVYDPQTRNWKKVGDLAKARTIHIATRLNDGSVIVMGGGTNYDAGTFHETERYDPDSTRWTSVADMIDGRRYFTASLLPDGRVMATGGGRLSSAELYDLVADTWTPTAPMASGRGGHTATTLSDGRVLVAGGGPLAAELYNPEAGTWTSAGLMTMWRASPTATLLADGRVLVAGGFEDGGGSAELFDPSVTPTGTPDPYAFLCGSGCQGRASGTFTSAGFLPGLELTFPAEGWYNTTDYPAELQFYRIPDTSILLRIAIDLKASSKTEQPIETVESTPQGLTDWMVNNPDMVTSEPETITIGDGIQATTFTLQISPSNVNVDPGCPSGVRSCLSLLWYASGHTLAIGYPESVRFYLFSIGEGARKHTVVVSIDAPDIGGVNVMTPEVDRILGTLHVA